MQVIFECPVCMSRTACDPTPADGPVQCGSCDWKRDEGQSDFDGDYCQRCRICGCDDLWRQKDFPPALGLAMVGLAILLTTIAWAYYEPSWAMGILMVFALVDMVLYAYMTDMLVCYRCRARHRKTVLNDQHTGFNLELSERYVQMKKRQDSAENTPKT